MIASNGAALSIGDIASRSGVAEGTLRMWEARYGFPVPQRLPSGHRRYSEADLQRVMIVRHAREEGLALPMAINRARQLGAELRPSIYAALRERFPHLQPHTMPKRALIVISRAIEDECASRAPHPLLLACFQHERFYRQVERRWVELGRTAQRAIVLADFKRIRRRGPGPVEVPLDAQDPLMREWLVVCDSSELAACLVGWERPTTDSEPRRFELVWTVEPDVVREAARLYCDLVARRAPDVVADVREGLADPPPPARDGHLRASVEIATRIALYATAEPHAPRAGADHRVGHRRLSRS